MIEDCECVEIIIHMKDGTKLPVIVSHIRELNLRLETKDVPNYETGYLGKEPTGEETWTITGRVERRDEIKLGLKGRKKSSHD